MIVSFHILQIITPKVVQWNLSTRAMLKTTTTTMAEQEHALTQHTSSRSPYPTYTVAVLSSSALLALFFCWREVPVWALIWEVAVLEMFKKVVSELARITLQVRGKFWRWSCQHTRRIRRGKVTFPSPFFSPALLAHAGCSAAKIFPNSHKWACSPAEIVNLSTAWDKSKCIVWLEVKRPKHFKLQICKYSSFAIMLFS